MVNFTRSNFFLFKLFNSDIFQLLLFAARRGGERGTVERWPNLSLTESRHLLRNYMPNSFCLNHLILLEPQPVHRRPLPWPFFLGGGGLGAEWGVCAQATGARTLSTFNFIFSYFWGAVVEERYWGLLPLFPPLAPFPRENLLPGYLLSYLRHLTGSSWCVEKTVLIRK